MSVREDREDREKSSCSSRGLGLGLAVAAIGVGVGAAMYYFFNNRAENHPDTEGSTQNWQCNENFTLMDSSASNDSYSTISEHSTSDTSIASSDSEESSDDSTSDTSIASSDSEESSDDSTSDTSIASSDSEESSGAENENHISTDSDSSEDSHESIETASLNDADGDGTDLSMDWDITTSSLDVPHEQRLLSLSPLHFFTRIVRREIFSDRKRTNFLEECSICFELVLKDQEVMTLPCTHHFHTKCILPWLQEQQTCPNCRQAV